MARLEILYQKLNGAMILFAKIADYLNRRPGARRRHQHLGVPVGELDIITDLERKVRLKSATIKSRYDQISASYKFRNIE